MFASHLRREGLHAALRYLNGRTPHRFTALYRYDGDTMRNVALYDRTDPALERGFDVGVADAYCATVAKRGKAFEFRDTSLLASDERHAANPVVCYCGVLVPASDGAPWGTLCHFDFQPCQMRTSDIPLLEAVAQLVYPELATAGRGWQ